MSTVTSVMTQSLQGRCYGRRCLADVVENSSDVIFESNDSSTPLGAWLGVLERPIKHLVILSILQRTLHMLCAMIEETVLIATQKQDSMTAPIFLTTQTNLL
jgi:hypothetical protein